MPQRACGATSFPLGWDSGCKTLRTRLVSHICHSLSLFVGFSGPFSVIGCVHACLVASVMSDSVTPWTVAHQAPLSMGFSRQEYWSG